MQSNGRKTVSPQVREYLRGKKNYTARIQFFSSPCKTKAIKQFQFEIKNDAKSLVTQLTPIAVFNGDIQDSNTPPP